MPVDARIIGLCANIAREGEVPMYVDDLLAPESKRRALPFAPTFRAVSMLLILLCETLFF